MNDTVIASTQLTNKHLIDASLWNRLVARIVKDEGYEHSIAERIMDQALGFLLLCAAEPGGRYAPSPTVDAGWHTFILYTRDYMAFCNRIAGRFIHHNPLDEPGVTYTTNAVARTLAAMKVRGMAIDEALWNGTIGDCGGEDSYTCVD